MTEICHLASSYCAPKIVRFAVDLYQDFTNKLAANTPWQRVMLTRGGGVRAFVLPMDAGTLGIWAVYFGLNGAVEDGDDAVLIEGEESVGGSEPNNRCLSPIVTKVSQRGFSLPKFLTFTAAWGSLENSEVFLDVMST